MKSITRKSLLYRSDVEYSNFCLNHVKGCSHGCTFPCYAFNMAKRIGRVKSYQEWREPKLVENALELLDKEIPKYKGKIDFVHLCFMTDPFMFQQPEVIDMSLKIIAKLNSNGIKCTTLTKGVYPVELTDSDRFGRDNEHGITLVSLDEDFRKRFEPFTAPYLERVNGLRRLHEAGLKTWISIEPYPTPNIINQDLEKILQEIGFTNKIIFGRLNYNPLVSQFAGADEFYDRCWNVVENFCKSRNIDSHLMRRKERKKSKS